MFLRFYLVNNQESPGKPEGLLPMWKNRCSPLRTKARKDRNYFVNNKNNF